MSNHFAFLHFSKFLCIHKKSIKMFCYILVPFCSIFSVLISKTLSFKITGCSSSNISFENQHNVASKLAPTIITPGQTFDISCETNCWFSECTLTHKPLEASETIYHQDDLYSRITYAGKGKTCKFNIKVDEQGRTESKLKSNHNISRGKRYIQNV